MFVAFSGKILAINFNSSSTFNSDEVLSNETPVTLISSPFGSTVISQLAVNPPSLVVTVIVAFPSAIAVTFPFSSTLATFSSLLIQETSLFVASSGKILAINFNSSFTFNSDEVLSNETPVTLISSPFGSTVISQLAVNPPSLVVTVIVAFPSAIAVTFPFSSTLATFSSLLIQETSLFVASSGKILAINFNSSFTFNSDEVLSNETPVTLISSPFGSTVISQLAVNPPSLVVTVIVAFPSAIAVIFPFLSTLATFSSLLVQDTSLLVAFSGKVLAINLSSSSTFNSTEVLSNETPVTLISS